MSETSGGVHATIAKLCDADGDLAALTLEERERLLDLLAVREEYEAVGSGFAELVARVGRRDTE